MCRKYLNFAVAIVVLTFMISGMSFSKAETLEEAGIEMSESVREGKVVAVNVKAGTSNGGPTIKSLKVDHPQNTVLQVNAALTVGEGYYKIELLDKEKPSLVLEAKSGQTMKGRGRMSVTDRGEVHYRVTSKNAKQAHLALDFKPAGK